MQVEGEANADKGFPQVLSVLLQKWSTLLPQAQQLNRTKAKGTTQRITGALQQAIGTRANARLQPISVRAEIGLYCRQIASDQLL